MTYIHHVAEVFLVGTTKQTLKSKYCHHSHILPDSQSCWPLQFAAVAVNDRQQSSVRDVENLQEEKRIEMRRRGLFIFPVFIGAGSAVVPNRFCFYSDNSQPAINTLYQFPLI